MKTAIIIVIFLVLNYLCGLLYFYTKDRIYAFLLKRGVLKSSIGPSILELIILQLTFPVQFFDMVFNGYGILCYVNHLVWKHPALPFTPHWISNDTFRRVLAYFEVFTADDPNTILEQCNKELENFRNQEQKALDCYWKLRRGTTFVGLLAMIIHFIFAIAWVIIDVIFIIGLVILTIIGLVILAREIAQQKAL